MNGRLQRNHQTREVLERAVANDPGDASALISLMGLCNDDIFDFDCAATAAAKIDLLERTKRNPARQLDIVEIEVLAGRLTTASERLSRVLASGNLAPHLRVVGLFYQIWLAWSADPDAAVGPGKDRWKAALATMRERESAIRWIFGGAHAVLDGRTSRPVPKRAAELRRMLAEMERPVRAQAAR